MGRDGRRRRQHRSAAARARMHGAAALAVHLARPVGRNGAGALQNAPPTVARHAPCVAPPPMTDLLILALTVALYAASAGLVRAFDRM